MSPVPYADIVTTTTHKTLRGPRGGLIMGKAEFAKKINSAVFPGTQGGPLMHIIAAKAICLREAATPEFKDYAHQIVANAKALADSLLEQGMDLVTRRHRQPPDAGRPPQPGRHRQRAPDPPG